MFWRRISRITASFGLVSAMYVKFCSGPTPMYAPSRFAFFASDAATWRYEVSFEIVLSEKKGPSGSERARTAELKADGAGAGAAEALGAPAPGGGGTDPSGVRGAADDTSADD